MYTQIAQNKRRTWGLLTFMSTVIVFFAVIIGQVQGIDAQTSALMGLVFAFVYGSVSYFLSASVALHVSGAERIEKKDAPELFTLIENLCIASGQPMPAVYIMEDDQLNAFATGRDPHHASVAFTTGLLQTLTKEELEGVAAHELSHIQNYDIRIQTIVVILVGVLALFADLFLHARLFGDRDRESSHMAFFIIGILLAFIAPIVGTLIQLAISREREFLADASGALLTRYPEGLAKALEKISKSNTTPLSHANHATAHMFFSSPFGATSTARIARLFSTHPPAEERIARLRAMGR